MRCMLRRVTFPALIALVCFFPAPGQNINGTIVGAIVDPSGAPISGATVSIEHVSTGAQRSTLSSSTGDFILGSLPPGEYRAVVKMPGFKSVERQNVMLLSSDRLTLGNVVLELGAVEERVTVTAEGATVQTASAEKSAAITSSQIDQLLVRGRSVTALLGLLPGVVDPQDGTIDTPTATSISTSATFLILDRRKAGEIARLHRAGRTRA